MVLAQVLVLASAALVPAAVPAGHVRVDGHDYISVSEAARAGGLRLEVDERAGIYTVITGGRRVTLVPGFSVAQSDGRMVNLDRPAYFGSGGLLVPAELFSAPGRTYAAPERCALRSVVLDAGHGGTDTGAIGPGALREKDVNLSVAVLLKEILERRGVSVTMTRTDDRFVPLIERSSAANRSGGDLFLSIHCNAVRENHTDGVETFALSTGISDGVRAGAAAARLRPSDLVEGASDRVSTPVEKAMLSAHLGEQRRQSLALAAALQAEMTRSLGEEDRGVKLRNFSVLRETYIPAALAEIGFISHWGTERKLRSGEYRRRVAEALACGLDSYARAEAARVGRIGGQAPAQAAAPGPAPLAAGRAAAERPRLAHRAQSARR